MIYKNRMASFYKRYQKIYQAKLSELLLSDIEDGTIDPKRITACIVQDIYYMKALALRLAELAESESLGDHSKSILRRDARLTDLMITDWQSFLDDNPSGQVSEGVNEHTTTYIAHQLLAVQRGLQAGLAAILPCYLYCYHFVALLRRAIANANIANCDIRNYLDRFAERLPNYASPSWDYEILKIWEEALLMEEDNFVWTELMAIFRESSTHEWKILE